MAHQMNYPSQLEDQKPSGTTPSQLAKTVSKVRHVTSNCNPHDVEVYVEVPVSEDVPHSDQITPRDLGVSSPEFFGQACGCFADDLQ